MAKITFDVTYYYINSPLKLNIMRILLIIGLILLVFWLLGFFAFQWHSPFVHALIVIGVILVIVDLVSSRRN